MVENSDTRRSAESIAGILGIDCPPETATPGEIAEWIEWWRESADIAAGLNQEQIEYLKAGGWWPPATAAQVSGIPPKIARRSLS